MEQRSRTLARFFQQKLLAAKIKSKATMKNKRRARFLLKLKTKVILYCHEFYTLIVLFHCFLLQPPRPASSDDCLLFQIMTNQILFLRSFGFPSRPIRLSRETEKMYLNYRKFHWISLVVICEMKSSFFQKRFLEHGTNEMEIKSALYTWAIWLN